MTNESTKASPFTEADWYAFAGAECWPNGDVPVLREIDTGLLIADASGASYFQGDEGECYTLDRPFPSQAAAVGFLDGLPSEGLDPEERGFQAE
jgi:hypothetical protein